MRGGVAGMVFQDPLAALNPTRNVAAQIGEAWRVHKGGSAAQARARALELLAEVGIPDAAARAKNFPHQFSGGMRQRVMIAMALACEPKLLIADEPTAGLDPVIARQIMGLIARLRRRKNLAVLFVTHDLSVVAAQADAVHVLYAGRSVEWGPAADFFAQPRHPYGAALRGAVAWLGQGRLANIPGQLPEPEVLPPGCCGLRRVVVMRGRIVPWLIRRRWWKRGCMWRVYIRCGWWSAPRLRRWRGWRKHLHRCWRCGIYPCAMARQRCWRMCR